MSIYDKLLRGPCKMGKKAPKAKCHNFGDIHFCLFWGVGSTWQKKKDKLYNFWKWQFLVSLVALFKRAPSFNSNAIENEFGSWKHNFWQMGPIWQKKTWNKYNLWKFQFLVSLGALLKCVKRAQRAPSSKCHNFGHRNIIFGKWVQNDKRKWGKNIICENVPFWWVWGPFQNGPQVPNVTILVIET